jgi:hypothetical protein
MSTNLLDMNVATAQNGSSISGNSGDMPKTHMKRTKPSVLSLKIKDFAARSVITSP